VAVAKALSAMVYEQWRTDAFERRESDSAAHDAVEDVLPLTASDSNARRDRVCRWPRRTTSMG
jgi:hypothetical protein